MNHGNCEISKIKKNGSILKLKYRLFLCFSSLWVAKKKKKKNRKRHQILKFVVHAIKVHLAKISSKFQVNRSTETRDIPLASTTSMNLRKTRLKFFFFIRGFRVASTTWCLATCWNFLFISGLVVVSPLGS